MWSDDGIVLRLPEAVDDLPLDELAIDPDEIEAVVVAQLPQTAMFVAPLPRGARRGPCCPVAGPIDARRCGSSARRQPTCWPWRPTTPLPDPARDDPRVHQRRVRPARSAPGAERVAPGADGGGRDAACVSLRPVPALRLDRRVHVRGRRAVGRAPRRGLALDRDLLRDLLGAEELRELIDPGVLADLELELQRLVDGRRARDADEVHDLLRVLGPLSLWEIDVRVVPGASAQAWGDQLVAERRAIHVSIAGDDRLAAAEDAGRLRDALGVALPAGLPTAFTDSVPEPMVELVGRFARTHGPFLAAQVAQRYGLGLDRVVPALDRLEAQGRIVRGEFRPDGIEREWCDDDVLRQLRRRSLAALRKEVEPVDGAALARFLPEWQGVGAPRRGLDALVEAIGSLQGAALPASTLEADVLSARVAGYQTADLDALCTSGDVVWIGAGPLGPRGLRLLFRDQAALLVPPGLVGSASPVVDSPLHEVIRSHLATQGASFWSDLVVAVAMADEPADDAAVLDALWDLVWAGEVTNDAMAPLRAMAGWRAGRVRVGPAGPPPPAARCRAPSWGGPAWAAAGPEVAKGGVRLGPDPRPRRDGGRWWLRSCCPAPTPTEAAHAQALQLLERHGVLTREATLAEGVEGGFAAVYPVLKVLEDRGQVRARLLRGRAGRRPVRAARRGRSAAGRAATSITSCTRPRPGPLVLAPPIRRSPTASRGAWPESAGRPARSAGAFVVSVAGEPMAVLERGAKSLSTFAGTTDHAQWGRGADPAGEGRASAQARDHPHRRRAPGRVGGGRPTAGRRVRRRLQGPHLPPVAALALEPGARGRLHPPAGRPPRPVLAGQPLVRVELARPRVPVCVRRPPTMVEAVEAQGKHLLIRFEGGIPADPSADERQLAAVSTG